MIWDGCVDRESKAAVHNLCWYLGEIVMFQGWIGIQVHWNNIMYALRWVIGHVQV